VTYRGKFIINWNKFLAYSSFNCCLVFNETQKKHYEMSILIMYSMYVLLSKSSKSHVTLCVVYYLCTLKSCNPHSIKTHCKCYGWDFENCIRSLRSLVNICEMPKFGWIFLNVTWLALPWDQGKIWSYHFKPEPFS